MDELDPKTQELQTNLYDDSKDKNITDAVDKAGSILRTNSLLSWSHQVCKGLAHLANQGVIHRDLALRNILLTSKDQLKIADFGLAVWSLPGEKTDYYSTNHKATPYKWISIESLTEGVFSLSGDIWSAGVLLWELFSLGAEPYGETSPTQLTILLQTGMRLERCCRAPKKVNNLLQECWQEKPNQRPSAVRMVQIIGQYEVVDQEHQQRSRMDSGVSGCEGYVDMKMNGESTVTRTSYWTNYKILNGSPRKL